MKYEELSEKGKESADRNLAKSLLTDCKWYEHGDLFHTIKVQDGYSCVQEEGKWRITNPQGLSTKIFGAAINEENVRGALLHLNSEL